jgi:hypothetical protein
MAEVRNSINAGEMAQRFMELVMMQAQQAAMFLGRIPNPQTNQPEINLPYARMFIDMLEMLEDKTRGNLSNEETQMLTGVLSDLRLAFVQASSIAPTETASQPTPEPIAETTSEPAKTADQPEPESRKRFTKSYGA